MANKDIVIKQNLEMEIYSFDKTNSTTITIKRMNSFDKEEIYSTLKNNTSEVFKNNVIKTILLKEDGRVKTRIVFSNNQTLKEIIENGSK